MNISKVLKNITAVDVVAFVLFLMALCLYFFMDDVAGAMYMNTASLFFFGISFIVDAINEIKTNVVIITTPETNNASGKATIQESL
jgi:hypothetical protein